MTDWISNPNAKALVQPIDNSDPYGVNVNDVGAFHAHLDKCVQCRDHPFALCAAGAKLLRRASGSSDRE